MRCRLIGIPAHYFELFSRPLEGIVLLEGPAQDTDLIHFFVTTPEELHATLPGLRRELRQKGCIWISWPKKSSGVRSDISEDVIRQAAFEAGLVDIKVCAVDKTWSALKLVIPVRHRKP